MVGNIQIEERAEEWATFNHTRVAFDTRLRKEGYIQGATEQKKIDKELIDMLVEELYTSRAYHLGITGLDSAAEIARKERDGDCALIRGIDSTIKYVRESMEE